MVDAAAIVNQQSLVSAADNSGTLKNYKRPTTIVLPAGEHIFNSFSFNNIRWYFEKNEASITNTTAHPNAIQDLGIMANCNSGASRAFSINPYWDNATEIGQTFVDGAIALQPNARVCVENDIKDATSYPGSKHTGTNSPDAKTDAVLVFPDATTQGRFTLRVKGNIDSINMAQDETSKADPFYTQEKFPVPAKDIFLFKDASDANAHVFASPHLGGFKNNNPSAFITNHPIAAPTDRAWASIFGV